jgi:O-antigen/teichoic acid export membrane protein
MVTLFRKIGKDTLVLALGSLATSALSLILMPLYTRVFSVVEYGTIELLSATAQIVGILIVLGMASSFNREYLQVAASEEERLEALSTTLSFVGIGGLIIAGCGWLLAPCLAGLLELAGPDMTTLLRLVIVKSYFSGIALVTLNYLICSGRMAAFAGISFIQMAAAMALSLWILLVKGYGLLELYQFDTALSGLFATSFAIAGFRKAGFRWNGARLQRMLLFALPMVMAALSFYVMSSSDRFFLQKLATTDQVAFYGVAYKVGMILSVLLVGPLTRVISPQIYRLANQEDCRGTLASMFEGVAMVLTVAAVALSLISPSLILVLATEAYVNAASVVIWVTLAYMLYGLNFVLVAGINYSGKSYLQAIAIAIAASGNFLLNVLLIPRWGILGAAIATTLAYLAQTVLTAYFAQGLFTVNYKFAKVSFMVVAITSAYFCIAVMLPAVTIETSILRLLVFSAFVIVLLVTCYRDTLRIVIASVTEVGGGGKL